MRWSKLFIPTIKENPAAAESANHRLLLTGGFIRGRGSVQVVVTTTDTNDSARVI